MKSSRALVSLRDRLADLDQLGARRRLKTLGSDQGLKSDLELFSTNDYLGLATHPAIRAAAIEAIERFGYGSRSAPLIAGALAPRARFEEEFAALIGKRRALLFPSGYAANVGVLSALFGKDSTIIADRLSHASIIDGARLSGARLVRFKHNDLESLQAQLDRHARPSKSICIVTESLFSMEGSLAPLVEIAQIADRVGATLMVDEAHGFGIYGKEGAGRVAELGVVDRVDIYVCALGKAIGAVGGLVAGSDALIDGLINFARSFIYSTAPPSATAAAASRALKIIRSAEGDELRARLFANARSLRRGLRENRIASIESDSPIIPIFPSSSSRDIYETAQTIRARGFHLPAIKFPTVPKSSPRFRASVTALHDESAIRRLVELLASLEI